MLRKRNKFATCYCDGGAIFIYESLVEANFSASTHLVESAFFCFLSTLRVTFASAAAQPSVKPMLCVEHLHQHLLDETCQMNRAPFQQR